MRKEIHLIVNEEEYDLFVDTRRTLLDVLRDDLGLTGTKKGCDMGECGACAVLLDSQVVNSCLVLAVDIDGKKITTIEGIRKGAALHPLQKAFVDYGAIQCGYCTPGMIMSGLYLLDQNPSPTEEEVRRSIAGNLCRCTGYVKIVEAILSVSRGIKMQ